MFSAQNDKSSYFNYNNFIASLEQAISSDEVCKLLIASIESDTLNYLLNAAVQSNHLDVVLVAAYQKNKLNNIIDCVIKNKTPSLTSLADKIVESLFASDKLSEFLDVNLSNIKPLSHKSNSDDAQEDERSKLTDSTYHNLWPTDVFEHNQSHANKASKREDEHKPNRIIRYILKNVKDKYSRSQIIGESIKINRLPNLIYAYILLNKTEELIRASIYSGHFQEVLSIASQGIIDLSYIVDTCIESNLVEDLITIANDAQLLPQVFRVVCSCQYLHIFISSAKACNLLELVIIKANESGYLHTIVAAAHKFDVFPKKDKSCSKEDEDSGFLKTAILILIKILTFLSTKKDGLLSVLLLEAIKCNKVGPLAWAALLALCPIPLLFSALLNGKLIVFLVKLFKDIISSTFVHTIKTLFKKINPFKKKS